MRAIARSAAPRIAAAAAALLAFLQAGCATGPEQKTAVQSWSIAFEPSDDWIAVTDHARPRTALTSSRGLVLESPPETDDRDTQELGRLVCSPAGDLLVAGSGKGVLRVWSLRGANAGKLLGAIQREPPGEREAGPSGVVFSPKGDRIAWGVGGSGEVVVYAIRDAIAKGALRPLGKLGARDDARDARFATVISPPPGFHRFKETLGIETIAFSPDGQRMAVAESRTHSRIWIRTLDGRPTTRPFVADEQGHLGALAFVDDATLACFYDRAVVLMSAKYGTELRTIVRHGRDHWPGIAAFAVSPDGKLIAFGGTRERVRVCSMQTGATIAELATFASGHTMAFSHDSTRLLVLDANQVRVFALPVAD